METHNRNTNVAGQHDSRYDHRSGRLWGGLFIVIAGVLLLARQLGADIPYWVFSFESILIALGLYIGIRHGFRGVGWLIPIAIGGFLLLDDFYPSYDVHDFSWPLLIIGFGLFMMLRSSKKKTGKGGCGPSMPALESADDILDSTVIAGGVKRQIISKNFSGGEAVTVFGGTELNFQNSDINGTVRLELTQVFGGTKLIIPPHWKVQAKEIVAILGGVDDKRPLSSNADGEPEKILVLTGTCVCGGIEIRSY